MVQWWKESFLVFVGNILEWGTGDLIRVFRVAGVVFDSFVPTDRRNGKQRNFAFVRFKTVCEMVNAIKMMDGQVIEGKKLQVNKARFDSENRRFVRRGEGSYVQARRALWQKPISGQGIKPHAKPLLSAFSPNSHSPSASTPYLATKIFLHKALFSLAKPPRTFT